MQNRGFTLIELLVVVGIIMILASFLGVVISNTTLKAEREATKGTVHAVYTALENYQSEWNAYPFTGTLPPAAGIQRDNQTLIQLLEGIMLDIQNVRHGPYLTGKLPKQGGSDIVVDAWGLPIQIWYAGGDHTSDLTPGPNNTGGTSGGFANQAKPDIFSVGPDGVAGPHNTDHGDDVVSWNPNKR